MATLYKGVQHFPSSLTSLPRTSAGSDVPPSLPRMSPHLPQVATRGRVRTGREESGGRGSAAAAAPWGKEVSSSPSLSPSVVLARYTLPCRMQSVRPRRRRRATDCERGCANCGVKCCATSKSTRRCTWNFDNGRGRRPPPGRRRRGGAAASPGH